MRSSSVLLALVAVFGTAGSVAYAGDAPSDSATSVGGKTAMDLIRLDAGSPSVILRNAGVLPGSESVEIDGRLLRRGSDYSIDNGSGVIYLLIAPKNGQSARVTYRFDLSLAGKFADASKKLAVTNALTFNLSGGNRVILGMGLADRAKDGTVTSSNIIGMRNNFSMGGGGKAIGFMAVGQRKKVQSSSLLETGQKDAAVNEDKTQAFLQNVDWSLGPGKLSLDYQDIGTKFDGFSSMTAAGFTDQQVNELAKEKGLKRSGFAATNVGGSGLKLSAGQRIVTDGKNEIDWRSYSIKAGALEANFDRRQVDKKFNRFKDLKEADRNELAREAGLTRENLGLGYKSAGSTFAANRLSVKDESGASFLRNSYNAQLGKIKIGIGHQSVDKNFTNFNGLREGDRGQLARERGLNRDTLSFNGGLFSLEQSAVTNEESGAGFQSQDLTLGTKSFSFTRLMRKQDKKFENLGALTDGELDGHVRKIALMYEPQEFVVKPESRGEFVNGARIDRQLDRIQWSPKAGLNLIADVFKMTGANGDGTITRYGLTSKNIRYNFRSQNFDSGFNEAASLMEFERQRLGVDPGMQKVDEGFDMNLGPNSQMSFNRMNAKVAGQGHASRSSIQVKTNGLQVSSIEREVGTGFDAVNNLADPERDLLRGMRGFKQKDFSMQGSMIKGLQFTVKQSDSVNKETSVAKFFGEQFMTFQPDAHTKLEMFQFRQQETLGSELSFLNTVERLSFARQIRNISARYETERINYSGTDATAPSSDRQTFGLSAQVDPKTSFGTERTRIDFSDGTSDQIQSHSISKEIGGKVGVTVTQSNVDRGGDRPDEQNRNCGFWVDLGHGLRFNYGMIRAINSAQAGTMQSQTSLTGGTLGNVRIDPASYTDQRWDGSRYQSTGNVGFGLVKPMDLGFFKNFTFGFKADTFRDYARFQRENRWVGAGGNLLGADLSFDYKSQIAPTGERAIDRAFRVSTAQSDKSPFKLSFFYKVRTMPNQKSFAIRDYNLSYKVANNWSISHQLQTNPEVARGDLLLSTLPQAARSSKWRLDFASNAPTKLGLAWDEFRDDNSKNLTRVAGVNLTLFAKNPSPLNLYYGFEHNEKKDYKRTAHRYHLRFDQKPGPNQYLSLFLGNVSWQNSRDSQFKVQNWSARGEFSVRF